MGKMSYYEMNKCLCKELCCEFEKFEESNSAEIFHNIKEIVETMVGLTELEAAGAMREYFEDEHGYDSHSGEFRGRGWDSPHRVYNAARIPTYTYTGIPYGADWNDRMYMNREDHDRRDDRDGDYMNAGRDHSRDSRGRYNDGRRGMDGKDYPYGIYNMAHMDGMKHKEKLTNEEYKEWVDNMVGADGSKGAMWDKAETTAVAKKIGIDFNAYDETAFWVAMNMVYSDTCEVMEKHGIDKPEVFAELADSWLSDEDTVKGAEKLALYYEFIVKK